jgi:hypothetical protein
MKRGQVTIFVLLGILLLFLVSFFFAFIAWDNVQPKTKAQVAASALIKQCVEDVAQQGIRILSAKGGYYEIPSHFVIYTYEDAFIQSYYPYYYKDNNLFVPDSAVLKEQFSLYLTANLRPCYGNTSFPFEYIGSDTAEVTFLDDSIEIKYDPQTKLIEQNVQTTLDEVTVSIPSTYYQAYLVASAIAVEQNTDDNTFCLTCLQKYKQESIIENIIIQEIALEPDYTIFYALNYTEQARGDQILFMFAGRYAISKQSSPLSLIPIPDQNMTIGYPFTYHVETTNIVDSPLTFTDSSDVFDIDPGTGIISFYPDEKMIGTHLVEVSVSDVLGHSDVTLFYITINAVAEAPALEYIGYVHAFANEKFTYNVTQTGNQTLYYTDDTDLFDIGLLNGKISFMPTEEQKGVYNITIMGINDMGQSSTAVMSLIIT